MAVWAALDLWCLTAVNSPADVVVHTDYMNLLSL